MSAVMPGPVGPATRTIGIRGHHALSALEADARVSEPGDLHHGMVPQSAAAQKEERGAPAQSALLVREERELKGARVPHRETYGSGGEGTSPESMKKPIHTPGTGHAVAGCDLDERAEPSPGSSHSSTRSLVRSRRRHCRLHGAGSRLARRRPQGPMGQAGWPPVDPDATLPLTPAYGAPPPPAATPPGGWPADPAATQPATQHWGAQPPWAATGAPAWQGAQTPPPGWVPPGTPPAGVPYPAGDWNPVVGRQAGTAYGTRPPTPPNGSRRGAAGGGSGRTPPAGHHRLGHRCGSHPRGRRLAPAAAARG